jgi:endogenous inhibitor of DNA gyrase (YacG/DUF329 family)
VPDLPARNRLSKSDFRPFCSERCRLIDLGAWLSEKHAIPGDTVSDGETPGITPDTHDCNARRQSKHEQ